MKILLASAMRIVFFGIMTPTSLLLRAVGRDPLKLKLHNELPSYWVERRHAQMRSAHFSRQFLHK